MIRASKSIERRRPKMKTQSLTSLKEKWLARLSPKKSLAYVVQEVGQRNYKRGYFLVLTIVVKGRKRRARRVRLNQKPLPFNAKHFRALDALVADGKLETSVPLAEWKVQTALGTIKGRYFILKNTLSAVQ